MEEMQKMQKMMQSMMALLRSTCESSFYYARAAVRAAVKLRRKHKRR